MNWWQYLLLVNVYLVLFYGFYALLLRKETFFQLNRVYLVSAALLSFFIPVIQADWVKNLFITQQVTQTLHGGTPMFIYQFKPVEEAPVNIGQVLAVMYLAGVAFLTIKLIWQLIRLNNIIKLPAQAAAYSFFKKVKLDTHISNSNIIAAHEDVHVKQWHSADVLIIEAVMIINWFNPIVYFYRRAIKHIHEFIADSHAIKTAANKADYALLLLSQTFNTTSHNLVNHFFNHSLLKQRIIMLQKNKSERIKLLKYGLSAPLFMLMLVLSSATVNDSTIVTTINKRAAEVLVKPADINAVNDILFDHNAGKSIKVQNMHIKPAAKQNNDSLQTDPVFMSVEQQPTFPGGVAQFYSFINKEVKYPATARANKIEGKVIVSFIIEKDGALSNIKSVRDPGYGLGTEAVRALTLSPKWVPGYQNGKAVRTQYVLPINFSFSKNSVTDKASTSDISNTTWGLDEVRVKTPAQAERADSGKEIILAQPGKDAIVSRQLTNPLFIVDGKKLSKNELGTIPVNTIESINIIKDKSAVPIYGVLANNGVVIVTTKKNMADNKADIVSGDANNGFFSGRKILPNGDTVKLAPLDYGYGKISKKKPGEEASQFFIDGVNALNKNDNPPIILVDGKEKTYAELKAMPTDNIKSIAVFKDDKKYKAKYGKRADNGVLVVETKRK